MIESSDIRNKERKYILFLRYGIIKEARHAREVYGIITS